MRNQAVDIVSQAILFIENNLTARPDLDTVAAALYFSKYHLHRLFTHTVGLTLHEYSRRRRLTEAAKLLAFSDTPILEIALISGYASRQAFNGIFKAMYKTTPAEFREAKRFYPLQHVIHVTQTRCETDFSKTHIRFASPGDEGDWLDLARLAIDGYPCLNEPEYLKRLRRSIAEKRALVLRDGGLLAGAAAFSAGGGSIDYLAVHPQYKRLGVAKRLLDKLADGPLRGQEISLTTFREGDRADTGQREEFFRLGFAERELLVDYGYPAQRLVLLPRRGEV